MAIGIGIGNTIGRRGGVILSLSLLGKMQFLWTGAFEGDNLKNDLGSDVIAVTGKDFATSYIPATSAATFQVPNNPTYIAVDTDYIWFKTNESQRSVTVAELIGYDLQRTPVKYDDDSPHHIRAFAILKSGAVLTASERDQLFRFFMLPVLWDNNLNPYGHIKANRIGQNLWVPETIIEDLLADGNSRGWYDPLDPLYITKDGSNLASILWSKLDKTTLGDELNSGNIVFGDVYKITACQENYFYTGCQVGDMFACGTVKALTADNKVQRYECKPFGQGLDTRKPLLTAEGLLFDGVDNQMWCNSTANQPNFIYAVIRQESWTANDRIWDGAVNISMMLQQNTASPDLVIQGGGSMSSRSSALAVGSWGIIRALYSGADSKFIINNEIPITGNFGTTAPNGMVLGSSSGGSSFGHFTLKELIWRSKKDTEDDELLIYNYLKTKYSL